MQQNFKKRFLVTSVARTHLISQDKLWCQTTMLVSHNGVNSRRKTLQQVGCGTATARTTDWELANTAGDEQLLHVGK